MSLVETDLRPLISFEMERRSLIVVEMLAVNVVR